MSIASTSLFQLSHFVTWYQSIPALYFISNPTLSFFITQMVKKLPKKITSEIINQNKNKKENVGDFLMLQNSDNPGMQLVSAPLAGKNYLLWSTSMMIALRVKDKLGFIDSTFQMPPVGP